MPRLPPEPQDVFDASQAYSQDAIDGFVSSPRNQFTPNQIKYPEDLGEAPHLQHYITFDILVRGKSKFNYGASAKVDPNSIQSPAGLNPDDLAQASIKGAEVTTSFGLGAASFFGVGKIFSLIGKVGQTAVAKTASTIAGAGAAVGTSQAINANSLLSPDNLERIQDQIALYTPAPPQVRYATQYSNRDLGTLAGIAGGVADLVKTYDETGEIDESKLGALGEGGMAALGMTLAKVPSALGIGADLQAGLSKSTGLQLNPFKEVIFEAIDFRSFSFNFKFLPRSQSEARTVKEIIDKFKFHMHPEVASSNLFFLYPSEFQISYVFAGTESPHIHKFAPCVLENMDVTYGGDIFSAFEDGRPTETNITLTFRETEIMTKELIEQGY